MECFTSFGFFPHLTDLGSDTNHPVQHPPLQRLPHQGGVPIRATQSPLLPLSALLWEARNLCAPRGEIKWVLWPGKRKIWQLCKGGRRAGGCQGTVGMVGKGDNCGEREREPENCLDWKIPLRSSSITQHCQTHHETVSLNVTSTWVLNNSRRIDSTSSPLSLFQRLKTSCPWTNCSQHLS